MAIPDTHIWIAEVSIKIGRVGNRGSHRWHYVLDIWCWVLHMGLVALFRAEILM